MDILVDSSNVVVTVSKNISFGFVDTSDPHTEKWKVGENSYRIDDGYTLIQNVEVPSNVVPEKHMYVDGAFQINPSWREPVTIEILQKQITELQLALAAFVEGGTL